MKTGKITALGKMTTWQTKDKIPGLKKTVKRLQDIEVLNPKIKNKLFFLIDTVIRDTNAQKAYLQ